KSSKGKKGIREAAKSKRVERPAIETALSKTNSYIDSHDGVDVADFFPKGRSGVGRADKDLLEAAKGCIAGFTLHPELPEAGDRSAALSELAAGFADPIGLGEEARA